MKDKEDIKKEIEILENKMLLPDFWNEKNEAQRIIKEISILKDELMGVEKYDKSGAILSILSGAGGDDAEDFSSMLFRMYTKYIENNNWSYYILHMSENDHGGFRNISIEISGHNVYGRLKNESGVHRLVRISPFNAKNQRHTSFSMVEVIPKFEKLPTDISIPPEDIKIEFSKSSGPGGQNVNKRETAVRLVHIPTNLSVSVSTERSQEQNKEKAMEMLVGKIYKKMEDEKKKKEEGLSISKNVDIEWGNQIRSYVLHPYKMIKDHRTGVEVKNVEKVLEDGEIEDFIEAELSL